MRKGITSIEFIFIIFMCLDHWGTKWHSSPVRQNENYVRMVSVILPSLKHISLAIEIEPLVLFPVGWKAGPPKPGSDDIDVPLSHFEHRSNDRQLAYELLLLPLKPNTMLP